MIRLVRAGLQGRGHSQMSPMRQARRHTYQLHNTTVAYLLFIPKFGAECAKNYDWLFVHQPVQSVLQIFPPEAQKGINEKELKNGRMSI
jgi:hypothetical protein